MIPSENPSSLLQEIVRMFYLQRCGEALQPEYAGDFAHPACHTAPSRIYGTESRISVPGGWHDAGDYGRYTAPAAKAVSDLLLAYEAAPSLFPDETGIPESGNGIPDVLDEARWEIEWMLRMMRPDGAVYHKVTCAHFCGMIPPHLEQEETILSPVSTTATGSVCGALALASRIYQDYDSAFAQSCRKAARLAYSFLSSSPPLPFHNPPGIETGEYDDACDTDERFFAAASLFAATGESMFLADAKELLRKALPISFGWEDMAGYGYIACLRSPFAAQDGAFALALREALLAEADRLVVRSDGNSYGVSLNEPFPWGSNMYLLNHTILIGEANRLRPSERYANAVQRQLNYIFGNNPLSICYVTGFGNQS
ncbi:MAG: glycoside hydrolase family 9 protein, partial [Christensenella sp.]